MFLRHRPGLTFLWSTVVFVQCLGMETGQQALVRAGDGTAGILAAMGSGLILVNPSQAGKRSWQVVEQFVGTW